MSEKQPGFTVPRIIGYVVGGAYGLLRSASGGFNLGLSPLISVSLFVVVGAIIGATVADRVWAERAWSRIGLYALAGAGLDVFLGVAAGKATLPAWGVDALEGALFGALVGANPILARRGVRVGAILGLAAGLAFSVMAIQNAPKLILRFGSSEIETGQVIYLVVTTLMAVAVGAALGAIWTSLTARSLPADRQAG